MRLVFEIVYIVGMFAGGFVRRIYGRQYKEDPTTVSARRREPTVMMIALALWGIGQLVAMVYVFVPWLDFADYHLPVWAGWIGVVVFIGGIVMLWRSHADLGHGWSPTLEKREDQRLVTDGVYRSIRHPMYTAHLLMGIGQMLLIQNWIAGPLGLVFFALIYALRVGPEEKMLLAEFGDEYRDYMGRTGRLTPKIG